MVQLSKDLTRRYDQFGMTKQAKSEAVIERRRGGEGRGGWVNE